MFCEMSLNVQKRLDVNACYAGYSYCRSTTQVLSPLSYPACSIYWVGHRIYILIGKMAHYSMSVIMLHVAYSLTYLCPVPFCQVIQYVGELCRYLLAQPYHPSERQHSVHLAYGNGLRPQIWREFQSRFGISRIGEFYGATEGNVGFFNIDNTPGACGFVSVIAPGLFPSKFIKVDAVTGDLLRDENGLAIPAQVGEPGLAVGKIMKGSS